MNAKIRTGQSDAADPTEAVRELHASVSQADAALTIFFCSPDYDLEVIAAEIERLFAGMPVIGCTTAGEIGPGGCLQHSLSGISLPADDFVAATARLGNLQTLDIGQTQAVAQELLQEVEIRTPATGEHRCFAVQLIDGLSTREELVTNGMQRALDKIPLVGGSAADAGRFVRTLVYFEGAFHQDSAVFALVSTTLPFETFRVQHFVATEHRMVVTQAEPSLRIVRELNGLPAVEEYSRLIGVDVADLNSAEFAAHPIVVVIDGTDFVRSVQKANPDGSLTFYSAVEEGLVLRIAKGGDLLASLGDAMASVHEHLGHVEAIIAFDCILRLREATGNGLTDLVADVFRQYNAVGFNTYGEQVRGLHVNQTLTGIAIGSRRV
jgi:hypothetical protein